MTSVIDREAAAFIHPSAQLYGHIRFEEGSSVWCNVVMRSEAEHIRIGRFTNIQDFVMVHAEPGRAVEIGDYCSITHHATIHACKLGNNVLVGVNATIFNDAVIGDNSIVVGPPAKVIRTHNSWIANRMNALIYHRNALAYAKGDHRAWAAPEFERWAGATLERLQREFEAL